MDPNDTLRKIREAMNIFYGGSDKDCLDAGVDITNLFDSLDKWLSKGGFLPDEWNKKRT